jgi:hypothetical protein
MEDDVLPVSSRRSNPQYLRGDVVAEPKLLVQFRMILKIILKKKGTSSKQQAASG